MNQPGSCLRGRTTTGARLEADTESLLSSLHFTSLQFTTATSERRPWTSVTELVVIEPATTAMMIHLALHHHHALALPRYYLLQTFQKKKKQRTNQIHGPR